MLVGVAESDQREDVEYIANKCLELRIFQDSDGKMNLSVKDVNGEILSISQFTLLADTKKGRRPSFIKAANPEKAENFYDYFNQVMVDRGIHVEKGIFGAMMDVSLTNEGPVTVILDSN